MQMSVSWSMLMQMIDIFINLFDGLIIFSNKYFSPIFHHFPNFIFPLNFFIFFSLFLAVSMNILMEMQNIVGALAPRSCY